MNTTDKDIVRSSSSFVKTFIFFFFLASQSRSYICQTKYLLFVSPIYLLHLYCTYIVSLPLWPINIHDACFSFSVSVYHLRYSSLLQLQQCNCFQCGLFWLPTLSIFASSCFFTIIALRCCCEDFGFHSCPIFQGLLCLLFNHLFGIGRGLRVRAFLWLHLRQISEGLIFVHDGRTDRNF